MELINPNRGTNYVRWLVEERDEGKSHFTLGNLPISMLSRVASVHILSQHARRTCRCRRSGDHCVGYVQTCSRSFSSTFCPTFPSVPWKFRKHHVLSSFRLKGGTEEGLAFKGTFCRSVLESLTPTSFALQWCRYGSSNERQVGASTFLLSLQFLVGNVSLDAARFAESKDGTIRSSASGPTGIVKYE